MEEVRGSAKRERLRRPALFLSVALTLGPLYAWVIVSAAWRLPWITRSAAITMFSSDPWDAAVPFALACVTLAWALRRRIVAAPGGSALWCSLIGGPVYLAFAQISSLLLVPEQFEGFGARDLFLIPLGSIFLGGWFGAYFLPVSLPLTWGAIHLLRLASGGLRREA